MDAKDYHASEGDVCSACCGYICRGTSYLLSQFHVGLNKAFFHLGKSVALYKGYFILVPIFLTALCVTGFQRIQYEEDPEYLFAPTNGPAKGERAIIENNFSMNYSSLFDPTRITRTGRFARFIITAKDGETILREPLWKDILELDHIVKSIRVARNKKTYGFQDLCAIRDGECFRNDVLGLATVIRQVQNGSLQLQYPINLEPFLLPHFLGGVETNDQGEIIVAAKAIILYYCIRTDNEEQEQRGLIWEKNILDTFADRDFEHISVARFTSRTLEDELENNTNSVKPFVSVTLIIMAVFSVSVSLMGDWVRAKPYIGLVGVFTSVLSSFAAFGFLIYIGVPFIGINMAAPFLMLGIGIDDTFVILAAWRRTRLQDSVPQRMAETYSEAAVAITITSLTDLISFFIGIITPFPSVQIFCIYTGTAVFVTYIWHITLFGGCLAIAGYAERGQKHSIICVKVKSNSEAEFENCLYRAFCTGGISQKEPWHLKDNEPHVIMVFFRDYIGRLLNIPAMKTFVICIFLLYLGGAIYGCLRVKEGLEKRRLCRYDSYSVNYYDMEDKFFRVYPYSIQVALTGDITYSDPQTRKEIFSLMASFESLPYIEGNYTQSVIRNWYLFLEENAEWLDFNITDEKSYISYLREVYVSDPTDVLNLDIKYSEDYTRILATRFVLQTYKLANTNADKDMMEGLRKIARESRFNVTVFNPFFIFFDQLVLVRTLTIQEVSLAAVVMMFVSLVFIPNPWCSMWVGFSIVSIEVGVVGFMALWDVNLDSISMINLIMCIGFSVDFSAHISYAYLTTRVDSPDERVKECLFALGLPIVQGGLSTILGVVALTMAPSYIFVTFFKIVFLVIFFGIMHGIFLLPVLLSLLGPGSFKKNKGDQSLYDPDKFVQKGDLETKAYPNFHQNNGHESKRPGTKSPTNSSEIILKAGSFLAPPASRTSSDKYSESNDRDMGIGTSGEDSSEGSLQDVGGVIRRGRLDSSVVPVNGLRIKRREETPVPPPAPSLPIKEMYSNKGFISDGDEEAAIHSHRHSRDRHLGRRNSHYTHSDMGQRVLQRNYSEHYNKKGHNNDPRRNRHHYRDMA